MEDNGHKIQAESLVEAERDLEITGLQAGDGRRGCCLDASIPAVCGDGSRTGSVANISHSGRYQQHIGGTVSTTASQDEGGEQCEEEQRKIGEP